MDEIIEWAGGKAALARKLNTTPGAVSQWLAQGGLPPRRAIEIERLSEGRFRAVDIPGVWEVNDE